MMLAACACFLFAIDTPAEMSGWKHADTEFAHRVEQALEKDPELLRNHRGYLAYLQANPSMARAEEAWLDLTLFKELNRLNAAFDESLQKDVEAQTMFDQFYDQLGRDSSLRETMESLQRLEFNEAKPAKHAGQPFSEALDTLKANPDLAMRFLHNPDRVKPAPNALTAYVEQFKSHPELLKELVDAFNHLTSNPLAQTRVFPWWQSLSAFDTRSGGAYGRLMGYFLHQPSQFWVWHQRHLEWAKDAQARTWMRYWHRVIRRNASLHNEYSHYLRLLRQHPEEGTIERQWASQYGPAPSWPPKENPPLLLHYQLPQDSNLPRTPNMPVTPKPEKPSLKQSDRIKRPEIQRPQKPIMPAMPRKPEKPPK
ncbi:MAG TPA: hypothetical protein PLI09_13720 [Candidatus Hydrogenedentes bacterium]|nr:hypothetical protein [Candidatus Hydrogenedentota bacterium]